MCTTPAPPATFLCETRRYVVRLLLTIVRLFELGEQHVADWLKRTPIVEPMDPFTHSILDRIDMPPWARDA